MTEFADRLRRARSRAGLTQLALAERSGVKQSNIAAYETGRRVPSEAMLARLLHAAQPRPSVALLEARDRVLAAAATHNASRVEVFGSVARSEDRPGSDLDLIVTFTEVATLLDQAALAEEIEEILGVSVDVVSRRALRPRDSAIMDDAVPL